MPDTGQSRTGIVWMREDLRVSDHAALNAALRAHKRVLALYIHETDLDARQPGGAARWWLHHSLRALAADLAGIGVPLAVKTGEAAEVLDRTIAETEASAVYWGRRYSMADRERDANIKTSLKDQGIDAQSFNTRLLVEPFELKTGSGGHYKVFTPFWKALRSIDFERPQAVERRETPIDTPQVDADYQVPHWAHKFDGLWTPGETGARAALDRFIDQALADYRNGRDRPDRKATSLMSPHLRFGEISPRQIWHAVRFAADAEEIGEAADKYLSEIAWREFAHNLLFHNKDITTHPMQEKFAGMEWRDDPAALAAWQKGETGIPMVDAGMRELWATGTMHNRVRMIVASFLAKNLMIDWRQGEEWFWDTLVDADLANNPANWQWVAGCGADAAPYFRIFNPVTQGTRFDPEGEYVRRWVPEIAELPAKHIHDPAGAPKSVLAEAGVTPGDTYPLPIVDLKATRERALAAFKALG